MTTRQSTALLGLANAALAAAIAFDVAFTLAQQAALLGLVNAGLAVLAVFWPAAESE